MTNLQINQQLSQRNLAILWQGKTDMITPEVVARRFFANRSIEAARSAIRRLCGEPPGSLSLKPAALDGKRVYYHLTSAGAKAIGCSNKYVGPHKMKSVISRYAISWFMHADQPGKRTFFKPRDFPQQFNLAGQLLPRHPFYLDETTERPKLGIILVDHNASARHTVHKSIDLLARFLKNGWLDEFIRDEAFVLTVLTAWKEQKRAVQQRLQTSVREYLRLPLSRLRPDLEDRLPLELNIQVIPGMDEVLGYHKRRGPIE